MHVAPSVPCPDNDEIRRSCFSRYEFVRQLEGGTPFNLLEVLALGAESPAEVVQACAHRAAIVLRGLVIDDEASRGERWPQRQAGNANEGGLKSIRQSKSKLDSRFAVAHYVDVHHDGCERGHLLQSAAIENGPFRLNHGHERCSASPAAVPRETMPRWKKPNFEMDQEWDRGPRTELNSCAKQPLLLLDGLEIVDDRAHFVGLEDEFRHVRVAGRKAFGQRLGKPFDFEVARECTKRRRIRVRTGAVAADRMAAGTVGGQQRFAASYRRVGFFGQPAWRDADREQAEEQGAEHCTAHGGSFRAAHPPAGAFPRSAHPLFRLGRAATDWAGS